MADISGMTVKMFWDATANTLCHTIDPGTTDFRDATGSRGITNDAGAGKTGDLLFTTVGHASGDYYSIILYTEESVLDGSKVSERSEG